MVKLIEYILFHIYDNWIIIYLESGTTTWGRWSPCSLTCGLGNQRRTRTCISLNTKEPIDPYKCKLDNYELVTRKQCDAGHCPGYFYNTSIKYA